MKSTEAKREYRHIYYVEHLEKSNENARRWRENNREKRKAISKRYYMSHKEECRDSKKKWKEKNPDYFRKYNANLLKLNPYSYRIYKNLRVGISRRLKSHSANSSKTSLELIGCDVPFLMGYLEARFKSGMTWNNYGDVWEIDHITPCASFDLKNESQQLICFNYQNIQPLFHAEHRKKHKQMTNALQVEAL